MRSAWLGLGGNIGDVKAALATALHNLKAQDGLSIIVVSPLYETPPWGVEEQPWFFNCCTEVATDLCPESLLQSCQEQERIGKRDRKERWGPRTIDIDILVFEGEKRDTPELTLPHPRMLERSFVLVPLADIAPQLVVEDRLVSDWANRSDQTGLEKAADADWWRTLKQS